MGISMSIAKTISTITTIGSIVGVSSGQSRRHKK